MMIQINICTRGTDNGDMVLVCHLGGKWKMSVVCEENALSMEVVPDFSGTHRVLQCGTLACVISHKASLILHQGQLRGLWLEIKRCTIHFLCISSPIIHLNCSEMLSRAWCQARCWLEMFRHVLVKGWAWERVIVCVCVYWQSQGPAVWGQSRACNGEARCTWHEQVYRTYRCILEVVTLDWAILDHNFFHKHYSCWEHQSVGSI